MLFERRADAIITRPPFPTNGLRVTILYDEPRALLMPRDHRLAGKQSITLDDLTGEPMLRVKDIPAELHAFWRAEPRPDGLAVAAGQAVAIVPSGSSNLRPDLVVVPIEDIEPSRVVLATRAGDNNRLVAAFTKYAQAHITGPGSTDQIWGAGQRADDR